jgi:hypothetical protein
MGTILGALATWLTTARRPEIPPVLRERAGTLLQQARTQGEQAVATLRTQRAAARQTLETRIAGARTPSEGHQAAAPTMSEVPVEAES